VRAHVDAEALGEQGDAGGAHEGAAALDALEDLGVEARSHSQVLVGPASLGAEALEVDGEGVGGIHGS
jgi:hypothetical protein